jgi:aminoglycoside 6-adenylyltransferase
VDHQDAIAQGYHQLLERLVSWAQAEDDLRAAILIGSRARMDHPADEWSDLDLLLVVRDAAAPAGAPRYIDEAGWLAQLGTPWLTFVEKTGDGRALERRVLFAGGLDADFAVLTVATLETLLADASAPEALNVFKRGARVLVDKDGWAERLLAAAQRPLPPVAAPTAGEFLNLVNDFWYHTVWTAKHLRRGELWWAKTGCDEHLKHLLRQMLEWQARAAAAPGQGRDTWMRGRFLEEWADPRAVAQLPQAFAHYDAHDIWRALRATMDLFHSASRETAERLGIAYPADGAAHAVALVDELAAENQPPRAQPGV